KSENDALANQKLISNLILSERNVRSPYVLVEGVKCPLAEPSGAQRVPLRRQTSAANMNCSIVNDETIRVAENAQELCGKFTKNLDILDALAFPPVVGIVRGRPPRVCAWKGDRTPPLNRQSRYLSQSPSVTADATFALFQFGNMRLMRKATVSRARPGCGPLTARSFARVNTLG